MWKRVSLNSYFNSSAFRMRNYVSRGENNNTRKPIKSIKGKVISPVMKIVEDVNRGRQRKDFINSDKYRDDPEGFGNFESDFMNVHHTEGEHEAEEKQYREQVRHWTVKNKFFKQNMPNFLTYAQKEQIKMLNSRDPEEWTSEKLSESFPADPATVKKILKARWTARSEKRIQLHDRNAMKNWSLLKEGKITNLSKELVEHLQKFSNRTEKDLDDTETETRTFPQLPKPKTSEFSSIITSCKKYREDMHVLEAEKVSKDNFFVNRIGPALPNEDECFISGKIIDKKKMRFDDLKKDKLIPSGEISNSLSLTENPGGTGIIKFAEQNSLKRSELTEIVISQEDMKTYEVSPIKEKIYIPRKLWKRGVTYKVKDCYYDDDGLFLYRVPGMTGKTV